MKKGIKLFLMFLFLISFCFSTIAAKPFYINMDDYDKRTVIIREGTLVIMKKDKSEVLTEINKVDLEKIKINDRELGVGESMISAGINYKLEKMTNGIAFIILKETEEEETIIEEEIVEEIEEIVEEEKEEIIEEEPKTTITRAVVGVVQSMWGKTIGGIIILIIVVSLLYIFVFKSGAPLSVKRDYNWHFNRATLLHRKAEEFYKKGKREKAEKFYKKAQSCRETGEQKKVS